MSAKQKQLGLVLEGGGARGAYQAGVLKALFEAGYKFNGVAGTSVGALNGVMVAQDRFDESCKIWKDLDFAKVLNISNLYGRNVATKNIDADTIIYFYKMLKTVVADKGVDTTNIKNLIADNIDEDILRNSDIDFGVMTFSLTEKKPMAIFVEDMPKGTVADYVLASATFPGFKKTTVEEQTFIDGGIYDNMPVNMLIDKGYKDIVAIETKSFIRKRKPKDKTVQVHYFKPSEKPGRVMDFTPQSTDKAGIIGYYDAMKVLKNYVGKSYYIDVNDKTPFGYGLCDLDDKIYQEIAQIFQTNFVNLNLLNTICCKEFKISTKNFADTTISVFEKIASIVGVERLKIYTIDEFLRLVYEGIKISTLMDTKLVEAKKIDKQLQFVQIIGSYYWSEYVKKWNWWQIQMGFKRYC